MRSGLWSGHQNRWPHTPRMPNFLSEALLGSVLGDAMTKELVTVEPTSEMPEIAKIFETNRFRHIPVVDDGNAIVGILSITDYFHLQDKLARIPSEGITDRNTRFFNSLHASDVMTRNPITLTIEDTLEDAIDIFNGSTFHAIAVVDDGICLGIITPLDILEYCYENYLLEKSE